MKSYIVYIGFPALGHAAAIFRGFGEAWRKAESLPIIFQNSLRNDLTGQEGCAGLVVPVGDQATKEAIRSVRFPVVNYSERKEPSSGVTNILSDHREIGEIAAAHLCEFKFAEYVYIDEANSAFSDSRWQAFDAALRKRGIASPKRFKPSESLEANPFAYAAERNRQFLEWLTQQPANPGILAANDRTAHWVREAILENAGPRFSSVGLLGIDDDASLPTAPDNLPLLSSIRPNWEGIGQAAAEALADLIHGRAAINDGAVRRVGGARLVSRETLLGFADHDPFAIRVARWLDGEVAAGRVPAPPDVAARFHVSHRTLSRRFKEVRGQSVRDYLLDLRIQRACGLLSQTNTRISEIAQACGFSKHADLTDHFRRRMGCAPREFRKRGTGPQTPS